MIRTTILFLFLAPVAQASPWFSPSTSSPELEAAHSAYLKSDFRGLALSLKALLESVSTDEIVKKNALSLLEKAYEAHKGNIPVDWKLPKEIHELNFFLRRTSEPETDSFGWKLSGNASQPGIIRQLKVTRYPDQVVLDKAGKIGGWSDELSMSDGAEFELHSFHHAAPLPDGLYLLDLELGNGEATHGWFILSGLLSSDTPTVEVPSVGQTFHGANPTMRWQDFRSPEYRSFERRAVWLAAWGSEHDGNWERFVKDPELTETTAGEKGMGAAHLKDGAYSFLVCYREMRRFGDLTLGRQSMSVVPFYVRAEGARPATQGW